MDCPRHLLIKQHVSRESVNLIIRTNSKFTQIAGAIIRLQGLKQKRFILLGTCFDHFALIERQINTLYLYSGPNAGIAEFHTAIHRFFNRSSENFPIRHIFITAAINELSALD